MLLWSIKYQQLAVKAFFALQQCNESFEKTLPANQQSLTNQHLSTLEKKK